MCDRGKLKGQTPEIREFFAGRKVFITGGTGFLGAVLLEKLLRACPEIETVYLLVRPKRMSSIQERVSNLLSSPVSEVAHRLKHILSKTFFRTGDWVAGDLTSVDRWLPETGLPAGRDYSYLLWK